MKFEALTLFENFNLSFSKQSEIYIFFWIEAKRRSKRYIYFFGSKQKDEVKIYAD